MHDECDFSNAKRAKDVDFSGAKRGALISEPGKERITIRLDADILAWLRGRVAGGGDYQALINETLRAAMAKDAASRCR